MYILLATPLLLLRAVQLGVHISEMDLLDVGTSKDMYSEMQRDEEPHAQPASQDDMDRFKNALLCRYNRV